ncbi:hypothetical protein F2Q69_00003473 [Brassica cretica]|uniref:Protein TSSC4 n=1 Tax=Brassica cretica TaxID=69181 RepID=A0A8S9NZW7_BRACR|nr:hypothetical protein F2Q69_00003473 [Brassica cretica]
MQFLRWVFKQKKAFKRRFPVSRQEDLRISRLLPLHVFYYLHVFCAAAATKTQSGSVWSLSGAEVEKREWKREQLASYDREEMPCASSFDEILRQQGISSTDRKEGEEGGDEDFGDEDDDWSIRASMGLDRTLDDEDEEDEYDKIALGKEDVVKACLWKMPFRDLVVCGFGTLMLTLLLQK